MALPKFVVIFSTLTQNDQKRFSEFARSKLHNSRNKLVRLLEFIENTAFDPEQFPQKKQIIHNAIFGGNYDALQINNLFSDLYKLLEKYLAWQQMEKHEERKDAFVIENLLETAISEKTGKFIKGKMQKADMSDETSGFMLHQLADQFYFQRSRKGNNKHLIKSQQALEIYYLGNQLKIWCEFMNRANILSLEFDNNKFKRFLLYLENCLDDYGYNPTIKIYYPILLWLKNPNDDSWYLGFRDTLFLYIHQFSENEAKDIVSYVQNYCVKRINQGRNHFLKEWFDITQFMLPLRLLHDNNFISEWTYKNIVTVGLRLKAFTWTENFMHTYSSHLTPEQKENAYQYNLAVYYYEKEDFDKAMQLLNRVHFTDPNYYLDAKSILLKIYFEHHAFEALLSLKDSVKIYLMRDKQLNGTQRALYKNLFNYTMKLYKLRLQKGFSANEKWEKLLTNLQQEVDGSPLLANKQWLQNKILELQIA